MTTKCPNCGNRIDHLYMSAVASVYKDTTTGDWIIDDINEEPTMWKCPECEAEIVCDGDEDDFFDL